MAQNQEKMKMPQSNDYINIRILTTKYEKKSQSAMKVS